MGKIEKPKKEKIHFYYNKKINLNIQIQNSIEKLNAIFKQKKSWVKIVHSLRDVSTASSKTFYSTASSHWCPRQQAHIKKEWKKRLKGNSNAGNSNANNARRVERNEERKKWLSELGQRDLDARIAREAVKTQNEKSPVASDHKNRESYCLLDKNMKYSP